MKNQSLSFLEVKVFCAQNKFKNSDDEEVNKVKMF